MYHFEHFKKTIFLGTTATALLFVEARAAAELLQKAARASEALAQQLPEALRRARKAEMENQRLKELLAEAEAKMQEMQVGHW